MLMPMMERATLMLLGALAAGPAAAHPHVFVDGEATFVLNAQGRLAALRVVWLFDPFYSMLLLTELGLDSAAQPDAAGLAALAALQAEWAQDFGGAGVLTADGAPLPLAAASGVTAGFDAGRVRIGFERALEIPLDPHAARIAAAIFDPSFFVAYTLTAAEVDGAAGDSPNCAARLAAFEPDAELSALQGTLFQLGPDEAPQDPGVGALFADRALLTCG